MDTQAEAQIYLAAQRGCTQTEFLRSYHGFNFGAYYDPSRTAFGSLYLLNDDTLQAGASLSLRVEINTTVLLLPVVGGLEYAGNRAGEAIVTTDFLAPGQVGVLQLASGMTYTVTNPYETEAINFLQIWFSSPAENFVPGVQHTQFSLTTKNTLLPLFDPEYTQTNPRRHGYIGQFNGRHEETYLVNGSTPPGHGGQVFVFVLQGVFEVANRLLQERDGLALHYSHDALVEFEALSNEAIILLFGV